MGKLRMTQTKNTSLIGNIGVRAVAEIVESEFGWFFHQRINNDVGIDGEIEIREADDATCKIIQVQIKTQESGKSYFRISKKGFTYYPSIRHSRIWLSSNTPVLVIGHFPKTKKTYWQYFHKQNLVKTKTGKNWKVYIPFKQLLHQRYASEFKEIVNNHVSPKLKVYSIKYLNKIAEQDNVSKDEELEKIIKQLLLEKKLIKKNQKLDIANGLRLLHEHAEEEEEKKLIEKIYKKVISRQRETKYRESISPPSSLVEEFKTFLVGLDTAILRNACQIYFSIIFLQKKFAYKNPRVIKIIESLNISEKMQQDLRTLLVQNGFVVELSSYLLVENEKLGRQIAQEVLFENNKLLDFSIIEKKFYEN